MFPQPWQIQVAAFTRLGPLCYHLETLQLVAFRCSPGFLQLLPSQCGQHNPYVDETISDAAFQHNFLL